MSYYIDLRSESSVFFKANVPRNSWFDYDTGDGGIIIDLVSQMNGINASGALLRTGFSVVAAPFFFSPALHQPNGQT